MRLKFTSFVAALGVVFAASSAMAALSLQATKVMDLSGGLEQWRVSAVGSASEQINTFSFIDLKPMGTGMGVHNVRQALTNSATPTKDEAVAGALFAAEWIPYDTHFLFGAADLALNLGVGWTETFDNTTTGTLGLPQASGQTAPSGFGLLNMLPSGSRVVLPNLATDNVPFLQVVKRSQDIILLDMQLNAPGAELIVTGFQIGGAVVEVPVIGVTGNGMAITNGDNMPSLTDNTDFGQALQGSVTTRTFAINNTGGAALSLTAPTFSTTDFSLSGAFPDSVAIGGSANFTVAMNTSTLGAKAGVISFVNGDATNTPFSFSLAGEVVIPEPASMSLVGLALVGLVGLVRRRS